jgi:hypothetical protein
MFEVKRTSNMRGANVFKIVDDNHNYLHSDGAVYNCGEYWPTREQAQVVLDKYRPLHVWRHGDVFVGMDGEKYMYFRLVQGYPRGVPMVFSLDGYIVYRGSKIIPICKYATFLFNINDKLGDF